MNDLGIEEMSRGVHWPIWVVLRNTHNPSETDGPWLDAKEMDASSALMAARLAKDAIGNKAHEGLF